MIRDIKVNLLLLLALAVGAAAKAQTFNFSQFHSVPLAINPALTGDINGTYRLAGNLRSQWSNGGTPYLTGSIGADFQLLKNHLNEGNKWGIGFHVLNDQSNGGGLQYNAVSLSSAYHLELDESGYQTLGLGFQGTYHERRINLSKLNFEEQLTNNGFINTLPVGEVFTELNKKYVDINAGLIYNYYNPLSGLQLFAGAAAFNFLHPNISLSNQINYHTPMRFTGHLGGNVSLSELSDIKFSATYMHLAQAANFTIGAAWDYGLDIESGTSLILGSWYRVGDAAIPYIGFRSNGLQIGLTYDVNTSGLKSLAQTSNNAYEMSMLYSPLSRVKNMPDWY